MQMILCLALIFSLTGCLPIGKTSELEFIAARQVDRPAETGESEAFKLLSAKILGPKCVSCHETMKDEANLLGLLTPGDAEDSKLFAMVKDGSMPMDADPLTTEELEFVREYIDNMEPAAVTFSKLKSKILTSKCIACHKGMNEEANVLKLVVAGKPEESKLFKVVKAGTMPKNGTPLSTKELAIVRNYIMGIKTQL